MTLLIFELKKIIKNARNIAVVIIMLVIIFSFCFSERQSLIENREKKIQDNYFLSQKLASEIEDFQNQSDFSPEVRNQLVKTIGALEDITTYSNAKEWRKSLESENVFIDSVKKLQKIGLLEYIPNEKLEHIETNNYYLDHNIKPDNSLYEVSAMYYVRVTLSFVFSIFGYIFFILLFYDLFLKEKEQKNIAWLSTLPISYKKITTKKIQLALILVGSFILISTVFSFLCGFILTKRIGSLNYPIEFTFRNEILTPLLFPSYFFISVIAFFLIIYLILRLLSFSLRFRMNSEKQLLIGIIVLVTIFQITTLFDYYPWYFMLVSYIDLHSSILKIFTRNQIVNHLCTVFVGFFFFLFFEILVSYKEKNRYRH